jgi:ABC-2 type transport system permease protein
MSSRLRQALLRFRTVFLGDLFYHARRPLFVVWALTLAITAWGLSSGSVRIVSGDSAVGGTKAHITSEFALAMQLAIFTTLFYAFFISVAAGMTIIQDEDWRLGELFHATPLRPGEYIWAKFAAVVVGCLIILGIHLAATAFFYHVVPNAEAQEFRGPFHIWNYLKPALMFSVPTIVFLAGVSFAIGEWTRRPVVVFLLPVAIVVLNGFFLWEWSPSWLDPRIDYALMMIDSAGFRWLNETWLKVDRGVNFYNSAEIPLETGFLISRAAFIGLGVLAVALSGRHFRLRLRGTVSLWARRRVVSAPEADSLPAVIKPAIALGSLGMATARPGLLAGAWNVARIELIELRSSSGLYLFIPLILLQTVATALVDVGFLDSSQLITPVNFAVRTMGPLITCLCLLLLFYTVETLERERSTRLAAIAFATPIRSGSLLLGKSIALAVVAVAVVMALALAGLIALAIQQKVGVDLRPYFLYWGLLLVPSILVWTGFVILIQTITQNRYTTYALALPLLYFTGYRLLTNQINWVGNWPLWSAVQASDISTLELDREAIVLSRVLALGLMGLLAAMTLRFTRRREVDATRLLHRLRPLSLFRTALRLAPWAIVPLVAGIWLVLLVGWGYEGGAAMKRAKDYWRKNLATYRDAKVPDIQHVELELDLFPERHGYHVKGKYVLVNPSDKPLDEILLTGSTHWEKLLWTLDGKPNTPMDRAYLYAFTPPGGSLPPSETVEIGFEHEGTFPRGISKRGGGTSEFILPSSVVLTSFRPSISPVLGFLDSVGVDDENRQDPKEYSEDFYKGQTDSFLGARAPFTTKITITGPSEFTINSVGTKTAETEKDGRRTVVWESDFPVSFFNVIAGRWQVERGEGTAVYYYRGHRYNIGEIKEALDGARRYYSEWFYPYPWRELKLSEFPNLASYAQGFPTNITFSEGIGFLTSSTPENHAAFEITSHEAAHQWWGNLLSPGKGPGGNILSEGTAHFSTILLVEQAKGEHSRIELCKRLEANYGKSRQADSERPLVKITGERPGDTTVTYDKGGWVFWMLLNQMGRDEALAGMRAFIKTYQRNPDHPVLQDFLVSMRPFAADPGAFDTFTHQWFYEVVVPEYVLHDAKKTSHSENWELTVWLENEGSGSMPVEVAAVRGERFTKDGSPSPGFREARAVVVPGKGESKNVVITCPFEPEQVIVDPDAKVLQLRRKNAVAKL